MSRILRAALTETRNAYGAMPASLEDVDELAGRLDELRDANLEHHVQLIARAAKEGAQLVGLGELFSAPYFALQRHPLWRELAEDAREGPTRRAMSAAARAHGVVLVAPIYELDRERDRRFNTALVIESDGELVGLYREHHIPEGENERAGFHETWYYDSCDGQLGTWPANISSSPHFPVYETSVARLAVSTCYDRHFEGVVRSLKKNGAELILSPAVTFGAQSQRMWELEFEVDAARHSVYIGGSNRRGCEPPFDVDYFGQSYFAGPEGRPAQSRPCPELVLAELDLDALHAASSSGWSLARDARPERYES